MSSQANDSYSIFKVQYKRVLTNANKAITIETNGNRLEAYTLYKNVIIELENVIAINISSPDSSIREDIKNKKTRLRLLRNNLYDSVERLRNVKDNKYTGAPAALIYSMPSNCQYHIIDNVTGKVVSSSPGGLDLYQFSVNKDHSRGFLIISDWMAPLMQGVTPVLMTTSGALIFFDIDRSCKVAVTLPYDIKESEFKEFITTLSTLCLIVMDDQITLPPSDMRLSTGDTIAKGLEKVSQTISNGIEIGTAKLTELMNEGSKTYIENSKPTTETVPVNPNVITGLEYARKGTHCVVEVSAKAFRMLVRTTQYLASKAAPHIKSAADNVIPSEWKKEGENGEKSTVDQIAVVTSATIDGISKLCTSLHDSAVLFGRNFARDSTNIMDHRYGKEVANSMENALYSTGNLGMTAFTAMSFTKKGIIKTAAQISAAEVVSEYNKPNDPNIKTQLAR